MIRWIWYILAKILNIRIQFHLALIKSDILAKGRIEAMSVYCQQ